MPLYERSVGFASVQSLCAFISGFLALLAPPVASTISISATFSKAHPSPRPAPPHLPPLLKVRCCRPKKFGRLPEGLPHHHPSLAPTLPNPHYPLLCTITLASLVKGEVLSPEKIRATTGGIASPPSLACTNPSKTALSHENRQHPCLPSKKGRWHG